MSLFGKHFSHYSYYSTVLIDRFSTFTHDCRKKWYITKFFTSFCLEYSLRIKTKRNKQFCTFLFVPSSMKIVTIATARWSPKNLSHKRKHATCRLYSLRSRWETIERTINQISPRTIIHVIKIPCHREKRTVDITPRKRRTIKKKKKKATEVHSHVRKEGFFQ